jgi:hypothetical protein
VFERLLEKYFQGERDDKTLRLLDIGTQRSTRRPSDA